MFKEVLDKGKELASLSMQINGKLSEINKLKKRKREINSIISTYGYYNSTVNEINQDISYTSYNLESGLKVDNMQDNSSELNKEKELNNREDSMIDASIENLERELREIDAKIEHSQNDITNLNEKTKEVFKA